MKEAILQLKEQVLTLLEGLSKRQKIVIGIAALAVIISLVLLILWASKPQYAPLFSKLDAQDAGAIVEKLDEMKVPYQLQDNGSTIMVPSSVVYKTRLELANSGFPKNGVVGFELFDQTKFGSTEFEQKVSYTRALNGELSRTIMQVGGVESARVQIVVPEAKLYVDEQQQATASVLLKLKPATKLGNEQVKGIVHLVASSVEGLKPENVTVVDTNGEILSVDIEDEKNPNKLTGNQLEIQKKFEKEMEKGIQTMLEKILGPGKAVTRVTAELDFDHREIQSETYTPVVDGEGIIRSRQQANESYEGSGGGPQGIPGTTSNIPQYQAATQGGTNQYNRKEITENFEINKTAERRTVATGSVKKLSIAVVVDAQLSAVQKNSLQQAIATGVGLDLDRGDRVTVETFSFDRSIADAMQKQMDEEARKEKQKMLIWAAIGLLALLIAGYSLQKVVQQHRRRREELELDLPLIQDVVSIKDLEKVELSPEEQAKAQLREELEKLAKNKPSDVAALLKAWLSEE